MIRSILIILSVLMPATALHAANTKLSGPEIWQEIFVPKLQEKFSQENRSINRISSLLVNEGGKIVIDHGGTRTADPEVHTFLTRIAKAFGLRLNGHYDFPAKHMEAIDLQLPNQNGFKWFMTLIDFEQFSPEVSKLIEVDTANNHPQLSNRGTALLEKLEQEHSLERQEAEEFVKEILYNYLKRHGLPLNEDALTKIAAESPETANALLLGPAFNHLAVSLNDLAIPSWYGLEVIEVVHQRLKQEGFAMLPSIQGQIGSPIRQTSVLADEFNFPVLKQGNITSSLSYPATYIVLTQRGCEKDANGLVIMDNHQPRIFKGFSKENVETLYTSTRPKSSR